MIPLLFVYTAFRRELSLLSVLPFVLPLSAFASYFGWHRSATGNFPRFSYGVGEPLAWYSVIQKGAGAMLVLGGVSVFFGVMMWVLWRRKSDFGIYMAFLVPLWFASLFQFLSGLYTAVASLLMVLFLPLGIILTYRLLTDGWVRLKRGWSQIGRRDRLASDLLLLLWFIGVLFYVIFLLPYSSVRYLLPLFPPFILLFVRLVEDRFASTKAVANVLSAGVIGTAVLGLLVAGADYELAVAQRDFAENDGAALKAEAEAQGHQAWFVGEFGFRYYMEQQGLQELPKDIVVSEGDLVIQSPLADPRLFSEEMKDRVDLIQTIGRPAMLPIRVTSFEARAGFYGHFWGLLPFSLSTSNIEEFLVYRVVPPHPTGGLIQQLLTPAN